MKKPKGKKIIRVEDLQSLPIDENGELHVDGVLMGPDGKWWIDEDGNAFFNGEMTVEKDIDPQYIQLDSQSTTSGAPARSILVHSGTLKQKKSDNSVVDIDLGDPTSQPPTTQDDVNATAEPGLSIGSWTNAASVSITPSSSSAQVFAMALFFGNDENTVNSGGVPGVRLRRRRLGVWTTLTSWDDLNVNIGVDCTSWGGMLSHIDSPASATLLDYQLEFNATSGTIYALQHSLVVFECTEGTA